MHLLDRRFETKRWDEATDHVHESTHKNEISDDA